MNIRTVSFLILAHLLCLASLLAFTVPATAQSVEGCLQAKRSSAIDICKQTLENGSRNENVYYKLASELFQQGQARESLEIIDQGLSIHPNNVNLARLKKYVELDSVEEQQLKESAKKNEAVIKLGKLKITCRTKNTQAGLEACRAYLSKTNVDKQLILDRVAVLEDKLQQQPASANSPGTALATNNTPDVTNNPVPVPQPTPAPKPEPKPSPQPKPELDKTESAAVSEAEQALRILVFDVQTYLRRLGLNSGKPDGIPGARTRSALTSFYSKYDVPDNEFSENGFISDSTLRDLVEASKGKQTADRLFADSERAARSGNPVQALLKLNQAEKESVFLIVPGNYKADLNEKILASQQKPIATPTQDNTAIPDNTPIENNPAQDNSAQDNPAQENSAQENTAQGTQSGNTTQQDDIAALLDQINRLELQLKLQEKSLTESLQVIDEVTSSIQF